MDAQGTRYAATLSKWRKKVVDCRSSGIPVKDWCEQHRVSEKTYYKWEGLVAASAAEDADESIAAISQATAAAEATDCHLVRIEPAQLPAVEANVPSREKIIIRLGDAVAELPADTPMSAVAELLKAVSHP